MAKRNEMFVDEAQQELDELKELVDDMITDGTCMTGELRSLADKLDVIWKRIVDEEIKEDAE
jgi:hypothetical protein